MMKIFMKLDNIAVDFTSLLLHNHHLDFMASLYGVPKNVTNTIRHIILELLRTKLAMHLDTGM
uniref:Uncharacterized protein n=1 Tax=Romanomermis culicivorax TaxID=13658 RepID=A0A915JE76_ROMCU